jgi:putative transposase
MVVKKAAHCAYDIHYHLVIVMKYRRKILIKREYVDYLCFLAKEIGERYEFEIEELGSDGDHVHLLISAPPRYAPSRIMQILKSITGRKMFEKFPEIKKQLWGGELWSDGGFVGTVGQTLGLENMKRYIKRQGDKDKNYSLQRYVS